ncbi:YvrJ protein family [Alloiococcus otitis]|uniref:YvrJ family protein n=1 Tax=Alloiococcus otitis ATCC 51267 TaxID=883081 RepID=K9E709_9LACT|nr:YvrJ family protein [Alloiococcus otitis]EKU92939.1 hypothetical protein HMPREF9698_01542 [Alloiococcus otitis ATCC 51267]SUU80450.1 YvrJ protein family [Alloiococcus otitis]
MMVNIDLLQALVDAISNIGFPIFITLFLLHRMEAKVDNLVKAIHDLSQVISQDQETSK